MLLLPGLRWLSFPRRRGIVWHPETCNPSTKVRPLFISSLRHPTLKHMQPLAQGAAISVLSDGKPAFFPQRETPVSMIPNTGVEWIE
jgi:hypothetical protein